MKRKISVLALGGILALAAVGQAAAARPTPFPPAQAAPAACAAIDLASNAGGNVACGWPGGD
jgi:hypothetical protein